MSTRSTSARSWQVQRWSPRRPVTLKAVAGTVLCLAVVLLVSAKVLSAASGSAFPLDVVSSDSMAPLLSTGDVVAWTPTPIDEVAVGDIVVFRSWLDREALIVHRVVEVREDFGKVALVTKGDANAYTDQAGPHVPEPCVVERNYVGTVLSVGPVPAKVPLVGYLALGAAEGYRLLCAPAASRGPVTAIGVIAPVTVSVLLLVAAVALLPQKQATVRERMLDAILGRRSLSLKTAALLFGTLFVSLLVCVHLFAYDSVVASVGVGQAAVPETLDLGSLAPGQTGFVTPFPIVNPGMLPVKGVVVARGALAPFLPPAVFSAEAAATFWQPLIATIPEGTAEGAYCGEVAIYSSPLWVVLPDHLCAGALAWDARSAVWVLDLIAAGLLTALACCCMALAALLESLWNTVSVNGTWQRVHRPLIPLSIARQASSLQQRLRQALSGLSWVGRIDLRGAPVTPYLIGALVAAPLVLALSSEILAMLCAAVGAVLVTYLCGHHTRKSVGMAVLVGMGVVTALGLVSVSVGLLSHGRAAIDAATLAAGAAGVYCLILGLALLPCCLASWFLAAQCRNVKERTDPLRALEGGCDL